MALATQDVETVEYFYAHTVAPACVAVLIPTGVLALLAWIAWPLALVLLPFLAWAGLAGAYSNQAGFGWAPLAVTFDCARSAAQRSLDLVPDLAELARSSHQTAAGRVLADIAAYQKKRRALLHDLATQTAGLEIAMGLGGLAVAVLGAVLSTQGWFAHQWLPLLVLVSAAAFMPVAEISQVGRQLADTIASTRRLHVVEVRAGADHRRHLTGAREPGGTIRAVRFTYPGRAASALDGVAFEMRPGSTVAVVGASGAGKSTVANLLLRFWDPQEGRITLGGSDLRRLRLDDLRRHIALVAQDTYLFNDTLAANIRLAGREVSDADVRRALARAALGEFVDRLPEGPRHPRRRTRRAVVGRSAPASLDRPRLLEGRADPDPRRSDLASRYNQRAADPRGPR